jgi:hypothetical protein
MNINIFSLKIIIFTSLSILLIQCSSTSVIKQTNINPDFELHLKQRIDAFYKAETTNDLYTYYQIMSPEIKEESSFEEASKTLRKQWLEQDFKITSWEVNAIKYHYKNDIPYANVLMDITIEYLNGNTDNIENQTDYWIHHKGQWYWSWRGWPYD